MGEIDLERLVEDYVAIENQIRQLKREIHDFQGELRQIKTMIVKTLIEEGSMDLLTVNIKKLLDYSRSKSLK